MIEVFRNLPEGKNLYFASDFHLGVPTQTESIEREKKIIKWLESIQNDAAGIFLLGDIFDFWFEYKHTIPKGFIRFLGKIAELTDQQLPVYFFTGNHDMWMYDYFENQLNIRVIHEPVSFQSEGKWFYVGHGDGLGPKDQTYKIIKKFFNSAVCQWLFARIHPNIGMTIAHYWSKKSRQGKNPENEKFKGENEFLFQYCIEKEQSTHHDYYIFGHRHYALKMQVNDHAYYINLGDWINNSTYGIFDGKQFTLNSFHD